MARVLDEAGCELELTAVGICRYRAIGLVFVAFECVFPCFLLKGVPVEELRDVSAERRGDVAEEGDMTADSPAQLRGDLPADRGDVTVDGPAELGVDVAVDGDVTADGPAELGGDMAADGPADPEE